MKTMRNYMMMAALLLAASMAFTACGGSDDDNDDNGGGSSSSSNYFTVGDTKYDLSTADFHVDATYSYKNKVALYFWGGTLNEDWSNGTGPTFEIVVALPSSATEPVAGVYPLSPTKEVNTMISAEYHENYVGNSSNGNSIDLSSGTVTIDKSGSAYTVVFTGVDTNNKTVKLTYKGSITRIKS
jgi:hypothetical protein